MVSPNEIEEFFLEAAAKTYAADAPKTTIAELPKSKVFRYERGDWLYVDCYFSTNGKSFGQTTIWHKGQPVWGMQYHGHWDASDKRVIPLLKKALKSAYDKGEFFGGRGPFIFQEQPLIYRNQIGQKESFSNFDGTEWITEISGKAQQVFLHNYAGMALI